MARRHRNPLNPVSTRALGRYFQGVDATDMLAAGGGLLAASIIPGALMPNADSGIKKFFKFGLALVGAAAAGMVGKSISPTAGKAAVTGGAAGVVVQAIAMVSPGLIGRASNPAVRRSLAVGGNGMSLGAPASVPAQSSDSDILTSVT